MKEVSDADMSGLLPHAEHHLLQLAIPLSCPHGRSYSRTVTYAHAGILLILFFFYYRIYSAIRRGFPLSRLTKNK